MKDKSRIAGLTQELVYRALEVALTEMNDKTGNVAKRNFVEHVISMAFFRVPEFRAKFLKIISEKGRNDEVPEWRNSEFTLLFDSEHDF